MNQSAPPKQAQLDQINQFGEKAINYYLPILKLAETEYEKNGAEATVDDFISIITIKLSLARLYSKFDFKNTKKKVDSLAKSLKIYEDTYNKLKKSNHTYSNSQLSDHLKICEEMINLMPVKISKINHGIEV